MKYCVRINKIIFVTLIKLAKYPIKGIFSSLPILEICSKLLQWRSHELTHIIEQKPIKNQYILMESFETFDNNQKITINITDVESIAKQVGPTVFALIDKNDSMDFEILDNDSNATSFSKEQAAQRAILAAKFVFIVDMNQEPNMQKAKERTLIRYSVYDQDNRKTYYSTLIDFGHEFVDVSSEQFTVEKNIEIVLKEDLKNNHREFVKSLNQ